MTVMSLRALVGVLAAVVAGCGGTDAASPTAPSPMPAVAAPPAVPPREPNPVVNGDIRVASLTHPSGSTLSVRDCGAFFTGGGSHICNDEWRGAFDVIVDRDLSNMVMTVHFMGDSGRCGEIYVSGQSFLANRERLVSTESGLFLTYISESAEIVPYCVPPQTTRRLLVQLWDPRHPAVPLLRREFSYTATFE